LLTWTYKVVDFFYPKTVDKLDDFGIQKGDVVVDYGCGPGRYVRKASELVGAEGLVYAADIHELAIEAVQKEIVRHRLENVEPVLINGYDSGLDSGCADMVYALDMFHHVGASNRFLAELNRILKRDGVLILEDGHQSREKTLRKVKDSGFWDIESESKGHLRCRPRG